MTTSMTTMTPLGSNGTTTTTTTTTASLGHDRQKKKNHNTTKIQQLVQAGAFLLAASMGTTTSTVEVLAITHQTDGNDGNAATPTMTNNNTTTTTTGTTSSIPQLLQPQSQSGLRLCTNEETRHGAWHPVSLDRPPFVPTHSKCYSVKFLEQAASWKDYQYRPHHSVNLDTTSTTTTTTTGAAMCDFQQFSNDEFCRLTYNKTVGFMGDSLTWEQFASLATRFGRAVGAHDQLTFHDEHGQLHEQRKGMIMEVCNGTSKIAFMRNNYLMYVDSFLNMSQANVVVLNGGAHSMSDKDLIQGFSHRPNTTGVKWIIQELVKHQQYMQTQKNTNGDDFLAIWRTSSPGHVQCWNFTEPVNNLTFMEDYVTSAPEQFPGKLGVTGRWFDFQRQNQLVTREFEEYNQRILHSSLKKKKMMNDNRDGDLAPSSSSPNLLLNYEIMHGYDVNILRPDGHVGSDPTRKPDCLHNCDPGPADVYNTLLLHLLRLQEGKQKKHQQQQEVL